MANLKDRFPENVDGKYYVTTDCIDCDLCRENAPSNFARNDQTGFSYVFKQPAARDEEHQCEEAMKGCPVDAIGNDAQLSLF